MRRVFLAAAIAGVLNILLGACAQAQTQTLRIWPGVAPGSEQWTQKEKSVTNTPIGTVVFNVVTPTLTAYLPQKSKANGTAVIVAPGGSCVALTTGLEGTDVAKWLQQRGIAAFLLKYRIIEKKQEGIPNVDMDQACKYGIADGIQALKVVRQHAVQWRIAPNRIGMIGFSAGGMVTSAALIAPDPAERPDFVALIYGAPFGVMPAIPKDLPPVFMAWAQDDQIAGTAMTRFYDALRTAGVKTEAHIFSAGGHGFGTRKHGTTSDHWIDELDYWLDAHGFTKPSHG